MYDFYYIFHVPYHSPRYWKLIKWLSGVAYTTLKIPYRIPLWLISCDGSRTKRWYQMGIYSISWLDKGHTIAGAPFTRSIIANGSLLQNLPQTQICLKYGLYSAQFKQDIKWFEIKRENRTFDDSNAKLQNIIFRKHICQ